MKKDKDQTTSPEKSRGRGRPTGSKTKPKSPSLYNNISRDNNSMLSPEVIGSKDEIDIKKQLTLKELKFLEFYLSGNYTQINAMKLAGYIGYHDNSLNRLARRIVQKYEQHVGDHRKIMRAMGYGEVKIIKLLIDSAENAKSETVRLNARIALAKCLGMQKEVIDAVEGVQIVIRAPLTAGKQPTTAAQPRPAVPPGSSPAPGIRMIK